MYSFISGIIEEKESNTVVINNNGIGYELLMSNYSIEKLPKVGEFVTIYTYLLVRETEFSLYGFFDKFEKSVFLKLITVTGIGPKSAIQILSNIQIDQLVNAIVNEDLNVISSIKGIGKKTAERVVLELKNKFDDILICENATKTANTSNMDMAIDLLVGMGINKSIAMSLVKNSAEKDDEVEDIIKKSLKFYNR